MLLSCTDQNHKPQVMVMSCMCSWAVICQFKASIIVVINHLKIIKIVAIYVHNACDVRSFSPCIAIDLSHDRFSAFTVP